MLPLQKLSPVACQLGASPGLCGVSQPFLRLAFNVWRASAYGREKASAARCALRGLLTPARDRHVAPPSRASAASDARCRNMCHVCLRTSHAAARRGTVHGSRACVTTSRLGEWHPTRCLQHAPPRFAVPRLSSHTTVNVQPWLERSRLVHDMHSSTLLGLSRTACPDELSHSRHSGPCRLARRGRPEGSDRRPRKD